MSTEQQTRDEPKCISREDFYKLRERVKELRKTLDSIAVHDGAPWDHEGVCGAAVDALKADDALYRRWVGRDDEGNPLPPAVPDPEPSVSKEQPANLDMAARVIRGLLFNDDDRPQAEIEAEAADFLSRGLSKDQEITEEMIQRGLNATRGIFGALPERRRQVTEAVLRAALGQREGQ